MFDFLVHVLHCSPTVWTFVHLLLTQKSTSCILDLQELHLFVYVLLDCYFLEFLLFDRREPTPQQIG